jgi:hypothetical protein
MQAIETSQKILALFGGVHSEVAINALDICKNTDTRKRLQFDLFAILSKRAEIASREFPMRFKVMINCC